MRELLAPDDRTGEIGRVSPRREFVPERAVGGLKDAHFERATGVVVGVRRQVDVEVRPVPDGEILETERVPSGRRLDDRRRATSEMEVIGAVEGP